MDESLPLVLNDMIGVIIRFYYLSKTNYSNFNFFIQKIFMISSAIIVVSLVNIYSIIPAIIMIIIVSYICWVYMKTSRDLKRFENIRKYDL